MSQFILWLIVPTLGVLWFLNLVFLLKNIKVERDTRNQTILGSVLTFFILYLFMTMLGGL